MTQALSLVQTTGQKAFTTSLVITANCPVERKDKLTGEMVEFPRAHKNVLALIRKYEPLFAELGQLTFETRVESSTGAGQATEYAILSEDQATFLMTLFQNTEKVVRFKQKLVKAFRQAVDFINKEFANPPRTGLLADKRKSMWDMTGAVKDIREELGKLTAAHHYSNENLLVNWALTGVRKAINEKALTNEEVVMLEKLRKRNAAFILAGIEYAERKTKIKEYADRLRAIKLLA